MITWLTLIAGSSILSLENTLLAASHTVSMKLECDIVTSLSLENTGVIHSSLRYCIVTSFVLASIKGNLLPSLVLMESASTGFVAIVPVVVASIGSTI